MRYGLRFGIPQLDALLDPDAIDEKGQLLVQRALESSTTTILGPDGTGKSVFALHMASTYLSDAIRELLIKMDAANPAANGTPGNTEYAGAATGPQSEPSGTDCTSEAAATAALATDVCCGDALGEQLETEAAEANMPKGETAHGGSHPKSHYWKDPDPVRLRETEDRLLALSEDVLPKVLYVSTDLTHEMANSVWKNFWLGYPWSRRIPADLFGEVAFRRAHKVNPIRLELKGLKARAKKNEEISTGEETLATFFSPAIDGGTERQAIRNFTVGYLDFASETTGDDWDQLMRVVASVPKRKSSFLQFSRPNLLIIDSVAGFETLMGDLDSFGQKISRRARLAELIRAAGKEWSIVLVVEEPKPGEHNPEEFVTDTVLRLRREGVGEHARRILEIEKARARAYGIGEHFFEIRNGWGTSTASWQNPDDPHASVHPMTVQAIESLWGKIEDLRPYNAYIQVFQSLHFRSHEFSKRVSIRDHTDRDRENLVGFGIPFLDHLLGESRSKEYGLLPGTVTALIGDEGTHKLPLAKAFLRQAHSSLPNVVRSALGLAIYLVDEFKEQRLTSDDMISKLGQATIDAVKTAIANRGTIPGESTADTEQARKLDLETELKRVHECQGEMDRLKAGFQRTWESSKSRETLIPGETDPRKHCDLFIEICRGGWILLEPSGNENYPYPEGTIKVDRALGLRERMDRYVGRGTPDKAQLILVVLCTILREVTGLFTPGVFITTEDHTSEALADEILGIHQDELERLLGVRGIAWKGAKGHLSRVLQRVLLVRRLELRDTTTPQLFHMIERAILGAMEARDPGEVQPLYPDPLPDAGHVRIVIGDLRLFREAFPDIMRDKLFLPTLVFRLRRRGVTSLLVDSDEGRPDRPPSSSFGAELRSLVDQRLFTWRVPFFGEARVAITVNPPQVKGAAGTVRELAVQEPPENSPQFPVELQVNPHFELYSGIEEGKPVAVPLQVLLYEETKAFTSYIGAENALFTRLFNALPGFGAPVIEVRSTKDYEGLRDYCQLPMDTKLPYTLIFAVDGYWSLSKRALRSQKEYLMGTLMEGKTGEARERFADFVDVFRLYRETEYSTRFSDSYQKTIAAHEQSSDEAVPKRFRWLYFRQTKPGAEGAVKRYYYRPRYWHDPKELDRVPFTWDFGFLLCGQREWVNAGDVELRIATAAGDKIQIKDVWNALPRIEARLEGAPKQEIDPENITLDGALCPKFPLPDDPALSKRRTLQSWRCFAEAAQTVAAVEQRRSGKKTLPFDLAMMSPDSLSCLWFEIWASEVHRSIEYWTLRSNDLAQERASVVYGPDLVRLDKQIESSRLWVEEATSRLQWFSTDQYNPECVGDLSEWLVPFPCREEAAQEEDHTVESFRRIYRRGAATIANPYDFPGFTLELYMTWLLLIEMLPFEELFDKEDPFHVRSDRQASENAVATRHWYKSACAASQLDEAGHAGERIVRTQVPVRLPGTFSVRGDWYLAVAQGSRSSRLADLGLDMLTSRRANRARLYMGLGLPTRDLAEDQQAQYLRTRLCVSTPDTVTPVLYEHLTALGADDYGPTPNCKKGTSRQVRAPNGKSDDFRWFFRTAFNDYDRQSATIRRWMGRVLAWTIQYRHEQRDNWVGGFEAYDELSARRVGKVGSYQSLLYVAKFIDLLLLDLKQCRLRETD